MRSKEFEFACDVASATVRGLLRRGIDARVHIGRRGSVYVHAYTEGGHKSVFRIADHGGAPERGADLDMTPSEATKAPVQSIINTMLKSSVFLSRSSERIFT